MFQGVLTLVFMLSVYCMNIMPLSYLTPSIVEHGYSEVGATGFGALKNVTYGLVVDSLLYGVIRASVNLLVETLSLFVVIEFSNSYNYSSYCLAAISCLEYCIRIARSSAYDSTCVFGSMGFEISRVYRSKNVRDNTEPCGTPSV